MIVFILQIKKWQFFLDNSYIFICSVFMGVYGLAIQPPRFTNLSYVESKTSSSTNSDVRSLMFSSRWFFQPHLLRPSSSSLPFYSALQQHIVVSGDVAIPFMDWCLPTCHVVDALPHIFIFLCSIIWDLLGSSKRFVSLCCSLYYTYVEYSFQYGQHKTLQ